MFIIYRDGFMLLVMGYTGKKALQIKLVFIAAFNAMEAELAGQTPPPSLDSTSPITPADQNILQNIVKTKVEALPSEQRHGGLYPQIWSRFNNHFRLGSYKQLPQTLMGDAVAYLVAMTLEQKALPEPKPTPHTAKGYQAELARIWNSFDGRAYGFSHWMKSVHEELGRVTGPLYKDVFRKLTNGNRNAHGSTAMSLDIPIGNLHHYSYEALDGAYNSVRSMYDAIALARRYAKMLEL